MGKCHQNDPATELFMMRTVARLRVDERFKARAKLAETEPCGTLLPEGNSELVTELIQNYTTPKLFSGGHYTGVRLHFARMSDENAWWKTMGQVLLRRCGDVYVLQPFEDTAASSLRLSFDGTVIKRLRSDAPQMGVPRLPSMRGVRLA